LILSAGGTANTALTVTKLKPVSITYPSFKQQEAVANVLDAVLQNIRDLRSDLNACEADAELILNSALYATFDENGNKSTASAGKDQID
jgi:hypothetical protein